MRYGIREICDVVFRAKANMTIGTKVFYKDEPVIRFDSLKTSTIEGATTTVYAQGGQGNARLIGWDGEKTVTFTMEDALISTESLAILTGAGVVEATESNGKKLIQHITEEVQVGTDKTITVRETPMNNKDHQIYVMETDSYGNVVSEPYIYQIDNGKVLKAADKNLRGDKDNVYNANGGIMEGKTALVDYYTEKNVGLQFNIKTESFGGNFYIEGSTLFRNQAGQDDPAEFIIPNGKVQTNFTITMASTGDPSTFTFTVDAFPDYLKTYPFGEKREKVYSSIQVFPDVTGGDETVRKATDAGNSFTEPLIDFTFVPSEGSVIINDASGAKISKTTGYNYFDYFEGMEIDEDGSTATFDGDEIAIDLADGVTSYNFTLVDKYERVHTIQYVG